MSTTDGETFFLPLLPPTYRADRCGDPRDSMDLLGLALPAVDNEEVFRTGDMRRRRANDDVVAGLITGSWTLFCCCCFIGDGGTVAPPLRVGVGSADDGIADLFLVVDEADDVLLSVSTRPNERAPALPTERVEDSSKALPSRTGEPWMVPRLALLFDRRARPLLAYLERMRDLGPGVIVVVVGVSERP